MHNEITFTPGPWKITEHKGIHSDITFPTVVPPNAHDFMEGWRPPARFYLEPTPVDLNESLEECRARHRRAHEKQLADARLIAASPGMYQACRDARAILEEVVPKFSGPEKQRLEDVIDKLYKVIDSVNGKTEVITV